MKRKCVFGWEFAQQFSVTNFKKSLLKEIRPNEIFQKGFYLKWIQLRVHFLTNSMFVPTNIDENPTFINLSKIVS